MDRIQYNEVGILQKLNKAVLICDKNGIIMWVNARFTDITGYSLSEVLGENPRVLQSGVHDAQFYAQMWQNMRFSNGHSGIIYNKKKNGTIYPEWIDIHRSSDEQGNDVYLAIFQELSDGHMAILFEISHDHLTGALNRRGLYDWMRNHATDFGVIFMADLDHFKQINDEYGHDTGDAMLREMASRLQRALRHHDAVARYGGDEFVGICKAVEVHQVKGLMTRIHQALTDGAVRDEKGRDIPMRVTIGVFYGSFDDAGISHADRMLIEAKKTARNTVLWDASIIG